MPADTSEYRKEQETAFVSAFLTGAAGNKLDAAKIARICPSRLINHDLAAKYIVEAIESLIRANKTIAIPEVARTLKDAKHDYHIVTQFIDSIYGHEDACEALALQCRKEGLKYVARQKLLEAAAECDRIASDELEISQTVENVARDMSMTVDVIEDHSIEGIIKRVMAKLSRGELARPLPTPWDKLNTVLKGGICPGELAVLAARPGMGKTAFAGCLAVEVARMGKPVLFISREVKDETVASRMMARESRVDLRVFRQGIAHAPDILPRLQEVQATLSRLPLQVVEKSIAPMTPSEVRRLAKSTPGIGLIVVDYLQLMIPDTKNAHSREREIAEMSRSFKQLALDCDCPVLLLSQLSRAAEQTEGTPQLSHLRESGAIEQDADIVMFLHSKKEYLQTMAAPYVQIVVAKGRSSGTGAMWTHFDRAYCDFMESEEPPKPAAKNYDNGL